MLEIKNVSFNYLKGMPILKDISLNIKAGEIVGIFGSSGCGKSTLAKIMAGILKPSKGTILVDGKELEEEGYCSVQLIYQHPEKATNPKWKMDKILNEGWIVDNETMQKMGIQSYWLTRWPQELSGGELQRFCITRALGPKTKYLIADEITTMLDALTQVKIWKNLITTAKEKNIGMIVVTHNKFLADRICDRIISLENLNSMNY